MMKPIANLRSLNSSFKAFMILVVLMTGNFLWSQSLSLQNSGSLSSAEAQEVGLSPQRMEKLTAMIEAAIASQEIPGAVALVARDGKIVLHQAFGTANASGEPLEKTQLFRLASQTKAITATGLMMLWEEGKFRLSDPVSKYIPEFKAARVLESFQEKDSSYTTIPANSPITIAHLLTHTSGLGYGMIDADPRIKKIYAAAGVTELFTTEPIRIGKSVKTLAGLPLHHQPGERFTYSVGIDVAGYLIEVLSGQQLDEFLKERIFDPLGMKDTRFYYPATQKDRLVGIQKRTDRGWEAFTTDQYDPDYPVKGARTFFSGGAGLSGTAEDYAKFLQMYLGRGEYNGVRLLSPNTVKVIMGDHTGDKFNAPNQYHGLAFGIVSEVGATSRGMGSAGTFDWGGYFNTQYFADPRENIIGILLKQTQGDTGDQTSWKFRQLVFAAIDESRQVKN